MRDQASGFKAWVERKAAPYAAAGMTFGFVARSAEAYSLGTFSIAALPPAVRFVYDLLMALCIAFGMELMMGAAGAKWWKLSEQARLILFDSAIPVKQRPARSQAVQARANLYKWSALFAALASLGSAVYYAFTNGQKVTAEAIAVDLLFIGVTMGGVAFFGIVYEPDEPDPLREASANINTTLYAQANVVASRISDGEHRPEDIAFLKRATRDPEMAHMLDALMPSQTGIEYWDTPRIMRYLGLDSDADARDIRRVLARAKDDPTLGVREKDGRRGLEAPQTAILALFGDRIEQHIKTALEGRSAASQRVVAPIGAPAVGQGSDKRRRKSGPMVRRMAQLRLQRA